MDLAFVQSVAVQVYQEISLGAHAEMFHCVNDKSAPATTDVEQTLTRAQAHLPAEIIKFVFLRRFQRIGRKPEHDEVLSYLMYPEVFLKFARAQQVWDDVEVLPSPQFFFGMQKGDEITVDIEAGKRLRPE